MPIVTLLTDYGLQDYYVAALKARILKDCPQATIVDISHLIPNGDIATAGFTLRSVFDDFPKGTVHLVAVGAASSHKDDFIAIRLDGHYFIGTNNGIWSLVSDKQPSACISLPQPDVITNAFPAKFVFAPAAAELLNGTEITDLGNPFEYELKKRLFRQAIVRENELHGSVVHVDNYGNLITNISFRTFEKARDGRKFKITFGYETFTGISKHYNSQEYGDCVILFNSQNLLEIAINHGNAAQLLGLGYNSPIQVRFVEVETNVASN